MRLSIKKENNTEVKIMTRKCLRKLHKMQARNVRNNKDDRICAIVTTPLLLFKRRTSIAGKAC